MGTSGISVVDMMLSLKRVRSLDGVAVDVYIACFAKDSEWN